MPAARGRTPRYSFTRDWLGETVVIMGNGTSMLDIDMEPIRTSRARVMVTNGGYDLYPYADLLMCSDRHWLGARKDLNEFKGKLIVTTQPQAVHFDDRRIVAVKRHFVEHQGAIDIMRNRPDTLVEGHTSVMTCISAAVHRGVQRIIIIGVDLRPGPGDKRRATDSLLDTPAAARRRYEKQAYHFGMQAEIIRMIGGPEVINCGPPSILSAYPRSTLKEALKC